MTRTQLVTTTHLADGHVVTIVDVDPARLSPSQRDALDALRRAVAALEEAPGLPDGAQGLLHSVGEGS